MVEKLPMLAERDAFPPPQKSGPTKVGMAGLGNLPQLPFDPAGDLAPEAAVYSHQEKEICWFDFEEVMRDAGIKGNDPDAKEKVTEYVMHHIPDWTLEI